MLFLHIWLHQRFVCFSMFVPSFICFVIRSFVCSFVCYNTPCKIYKITCGNLEDRRCFNGSIWEVVGLVNAEWFYEFFIMKHSNQTMHWSSLLTSGIFTAFQVVSANFDEVCNIDLKHCVFPFVLEVFCVFSLFWFIGTVIFNLIGNNIEF